MAARALKKPDPATFAIIFGFLIAVIAYVLQSNGVDMNWWISAIAYLFAGVVGCWSIWTHATPHWGITRRVFSLVVWSVGILWLGWCGARKQYLKEKETPKRQWYLKISNANITPQKPNGVESPFRVTAEINGLTYGYPSSLVWVEQETTPI